MQRRPERISSLNVERGLYVLHYVGSTGAEAPTIYVRSSPGDEASVSVIPFPGDSAGRLTSAGTLMVIVASQTATLQITAQAVSPTGSLNAELKLEPLKPATMGGAAAVSVASPVPSRVAVPDEIAGSLPVQAGAERLTLLAHVARRGDVAVSEGAWIAGPDAPSPIEGLSVECPASLGSLQFQVLASGDPRWSEWLPSGAFGGSRGRAAPLVGLRLRLFPVAGSGATLGGEALFLGSAIIRKDGRDLEFRSAAGLDPLVGLRVEIKRDVQEPQPKPEIPAAVPHGGRVRVFRASSRRSG